MIVATDYLPPGLYRMGPVLGLHDFDTGGRGPWQAVATRVVREQWHLGHGAPVPFRKPEPGDEGVLVSFPGVEMVRVQRFTRLE